MKAKQNKLDNEFVVIYKFNVIDSFENNFMEGWKGLTELIYQYEFSFGSRLHKVDNEIYIAYAIWPSKAVWANAGSNLPIGADRFKKLMKSSCSNIETLYELTVVEDLIENKQYNKQ